MNNLKQAYDAIKGGADNVLRNLIHNHPSLVHEMTPFGTLLHVAAKLGDISKIKYLIEQGADLEKRGGIFGGTALNQAAANGQLQAVRYLLSAGARVEVDEPERNPLFSAINSGSLNIVELLIEWGVDPSISYTGASMNDMDALAFSVELGKKDIADYLRSLR